MRAEPKGAAARAPQDLLSSLKPGRPPAQRAATLQQAAGKGLLVEVLPAKAVKPLVQKILELGGHLRRGRLESSK